MRICMLLAGQDFPPDARVEREARALASAGHEILVLASNYTDSPPRDLWQDNISVVRLPTSPRILFGLSRRIRFELFIDIQWLVFLYGLVRRERVDILHVHDLPMALTAWLVGKLKNIPVVLDLHENWPVLVSMSAALKHSRPRRLTNLQRWQKYEKWAISNVDKVIVVIEEARDRLTELGCPAEKITVVSNTIDVDRFCSYPIDKTISQQYAEEFAVSYIGTFGLHRGLDIAIKAMPLLLEKVPNARLLLVGVDEKTQKLAQQLQNLTKEISVSDRVIFLEHQEFNKIPSWIKASDVGLIPHNTNPHTNATVPNKLFQYMCLGKPVVVSDCPPLKRVVESSRSGLVFESGNSVALSAVLSKLEDEALRKELGANGREAVRQIYNWQKDALKLLRLYQELEKAEF